MVYSTFHHFRVAPTNARLISSIEYSRHTIFGASKNLRRAVAARWRSKRLVFNVILNSIIQIEILANVKKTILDVLDLGIKPWVTNLYWNSRWNQYGRLRSIQQLTCWYFENIKNIRWGFMTEMKIPQKILYWHKKAERKKVSQLYSQFQVSLLFCMVHVFKFPCYCKCVLR